MTRAIAAALLLLSTGCAAVDRGRPIERSFGGTFTQDGVRRSRADARDALEAYEPSRDEARSAGRSLAGAGAFAAGGMVVLVTGLVPSDLPDRMRLAMAGAGFAMVYGVAIPLWISAEVHERRAVRAYNAQFADAPPASSGARVLPVAGAVPDAAGHPTPVGGVAVAF